MRSENRETIQLKPSAPDVDYLLYMGMSLDQAHREKQELEQRFEQLIHLSGGNLTALDNSSAGLPDVVRLRLENQRLREENAALVWRLNRKKYKLVDKIDELFKKVAPLRSALLACANLLLRAKRRLTGRAG